MSAWWDDDPIPLAEHDTCMICGESDAPWDGSEYTHPECWALLDDPDWRLWWESHMTLRHLNLADTLTDDDTHPVAVNEESANAGEAGSSPASPATSYTNVEPSDVELGDRLAGYPGNPVVARIVYAGRSGEWLFGDADDQLICHVPVGGQVQVCVDETGLAAGVGRHPAGGGR